MRAKKALSAFLALALILTGVSAWTIPASAAENSDTGAVYSVEEAYLNGDYMTFTVFAEATGEYTVNFVANSDETAEAEVSINGIASGTLQIPSEGNQLKLNKGLNTIRLAYTKILSAIELPECAPKAERGVTAAYVTYEAEDCETGAAILEDSRVFREIATEASGRRAVRLETAEDSVKLTLQEDTNAITLRTCVPDSEDGTGLDCTLTLSIGGDTVDVVADSRQSWVYGKYPYTNEPADEQAHNFFDDHSFLLDKVYPAGTELVISKAASDTAEYCILDLIETELVEEAMPQPENSISITKHGAKANDGKDDTQALLDAIDAAVEEGKEVWLPAGEFTFTQSRMVISDDGVTIRGAGMWHTVLTGDFAAFYITGNDTAFYDFKMEGTAVRRRDAEDPAAYEIASGSLPNANFILQNVWIEHYKVGAWIYNTSGVHITGCRIRNTFADGINLCMGTCNSLVEQSSFRGTGDDSVAMWSQYYADVNNVVRYNNISLPDLANCIAVYGGQDITICDNIVADVITEGSGINISTNFQPAAFGEQVIVERNTLYRCGSKNDLNGAMQGAIWFNTLSPYDNNAEVIVRDNTILDSSYMGISFSGTGAATNVLIENNTIENGTMGGISSVSSAIGKAVVQNNQISGFPRGEVVNNNAPNFTWVVDGVEIVGEKPEVQLFFDKPVGATEAPASEPTEAPVTEQPAVEKTNPMPIVIAVVAAVIVLGLAVVTIVFKKSEKK